MEHFLPGLAICWEKNADAEMLVHAVQFITPGGVSSDCDCV